MEKRQEKSGHKKIRWSVGAESAFEGVVSTCRKECTRTRDGVKGGDLPEMNMRVNIHHMEFSVVYYSKNLKETLWTWPAGIRASFIRILERMKTFGPDLGLPYTRAMGQGLFEIRAKGPEGIGRIFYCVLIDRKIVILHAFIKKTEKTPKGELALARGRLKEVRRG